MRTSRDSSTELGPGDVAVQAHLLLNAFALMAGRASTLRVHWDRLPADTRAEWLTEMELAATRASGLFRELVLGHSVHQP